MTRAVFAEAFDALFLIEDDGRVIEASELARTLEPLGVASFFGSDAPGATILRSELRRGLRPAIEVEIGGHTLAMEGKTIHEGRHMIVVRDVTERRALEEELASLRRIDSLGRVTGRLVHDFNNVLQPIIMLSSLLEDTTERSTPSATYATELREAAGRAASLVHHLLGFLRDSPGRPEILDPNRSLADVAPLLKRLLGHDAELAIDLGDRVGAIRADRDQLERVLLNLVANAREAMPRGGRVTIATSITQLGEGDGSALEEAPPGPYVTVRVRDTGEGMDAATRGRVLEGSFSTKGPGRGTGLSSAQAFALANGGAITIESEPGEGTTVVMHLPRVGDSVTSSAPPPRSKPRGGSETILVVEDDASVRRVVRLCLENKGYRVLEAADGAQALVVSAAHRGSIDLVIVDLVLGKESGVSLAKRIAATRASTRVVFMTGSAKTSVSFPAPVLTKTFTPRALAEMVRATLDAR
ncbi:MAG: ATP-binding protein [Polyangiales bacterium]